MSARPPMSALLRGIRQYLQTILNVNSTFVEIDPEGRPPPNCPHWRISIAPGSSQLIAGNQLYMERSLSVAVNITKRISVIPRDRRNYSYIDETDSLEVLTERVIACVPQQACLVLANTFIDSDSSGVEGFQRPLRYSSHTSPQVMTGDWADLEPEKAAFLVQEIRFDGALIQQKLANLLAAIPPYVAP
ncbi:MAG: hypothetical protein QM811_07030 [Pirellulales bacterium]